MSFVSVLTDVSGTLNCLAALSPLAPLANPLLESLSLCAEWIVIKSNARCICFSSRNDVDIVPYKGGVCIAGAALAPPATHHL